MLYPFVFNYNLCNEKPHANISSSLFYQIMKIAFALNWTIRIILNLLNKKNFVLRKTECYFFLKNSRYSLFLVLLLKSLVCLFFVTLHNFQKHFMVSFVTLPKCLETLSESRIFFQMPWVLRVHIGGGNLGIFHFYN